jgi:hypothetical protein
VRLVLLSTALYRNRLSYEMSSSGTSRYFGDVNIRVATIVDVLPKTEMEVRGTTSTICVKQVHQLDRLFEHHSCCSLVVRLEP